MATKDKYIHLESFGLQVIEIHSNYFWQRGDFIGKLGCLTIERKDAACSKGRLNWELDALLTVPLLFVDQLLSEVGNLQIPQSCH